MTATELLNQIRQEIERRIKVYDESIEKYAGKQKSIKAERDSWKWAECKSFLSFLDTLQVDEPKGLDEAAKQCQEELYDGYYSGHQEGYQVAFKAGAEWEKQQMMKDAVVVLVDDLNGDLYNRCIERGFTGEDEVKLIIVMEDSK